MYRQTGPGGLPLALRLNEWLGRTQVPDEQGFVIVPAADKEYPWRDTVLSKAFAAIERHGGRVSRCHSQRDLFKANPTGRVTQGDGEEFATQTRTTTRWFNVHAANKRSMLLFSAGFSLYADRRNEFGLSKGAEENSFFGSGED